MLAKNRRLDCSVQPEVPPLIPNSTRAGQPEIYLDEPHKDTTEPIIIEEIFYDEDNLLQTLNTQETTVGTR